jgi:hypothetical protein
VKGEWMIDQHILSGDDLELSFMVKHPDFLGDERWTSMEKKRHIKTTEKLRSHI